MRAATPEAKGLTTSEGKLAVAAMGAVLLLEGSLIPMLQVLSESYPDQAWVALALPLAGAILQALTLAGYTRSRTAVKVAMLKRGP